MSRGKVRNAKATGLSRNSFSKKQHRDALLRRRIKFVVEKGAMARLFKKGTGQQLQEKLFLRIQPNKLARIASRRSYDNWLTRTIEADCWKAHSRCGLGADRWAYFGKLINIIVYEVVSSRELFRDVDWIRIRQFLHVPIDRNVVEYFQEIQPSFTEIRVLRGMRKHTYIQLQHAIRRVAKACEVPPIWFEAAYIHRDKF